MRSITDVFIKHPVLAVVVNLIIVLVGWRALSTLPIQQYPSIQSSSVLITTIYTGASAETVRGFLTTPIERVVSAISGVDFTRATRQASGFRSTPTDGRPRSMASSSVVPPPTNGSTTRSPGAEWSRISAAGRCAWNFAG